MIGRPKGIWIRLGRRGVAALEFVLIGPFMIMLILGIIEFTAAIRIQMAVDNAARAVANLIVQKAGVTTAQLNDFFIAGQDCLAFTPASLSMSATSVNFANGAAVGAIGWDAASVATSYIAAPANVLVLTTGLGGSSSGLIAGGDSAIMVRTQATFNVPLPLGAINPTYTFTSTAFARPRLGFIVKLN